ncbi:MAG: beta-propeller fold lactonase family protein [Verrucomicrobiae bacterium]|nr:beta-propeller fold lactonase family protein [Verrucomicrobiae bacterium]
MLVSSGISSESFSLFVPDLANQQLLSLAVNASGTDVSIHTRKPLALPFAPRGITLNPNGRQLIVNGDDNNETPVATVDILKDGALRLVASSRLKHPAGYTSVDRTGRYFLMVNYQTGQVSVYAIDREGAVGEAVDSLRTPKKEAHCILTTPDNRFVYIPCVKLNNALYQYAFDETSGQLTPLEPFNAQPPALFGPRHVAYHPTLPIAYFSNEQQLGVSVYEIRKDGQLKDRQHVSTIPRRSPFEPGKRDLHASDIALTPNSKFLFVAVRDFNGDEDSVFSFRVDTEGTLSLIDRSKTGDIPWKIDVSPKGNYLMVRETGDQTLSFFKVSSDGSLQHAKTLNLPAQTNDFSLVGTD